MSQVTQTIETPPGPAELWTLTIVEPFASLIALSDEDARAKRVENRTWRPNPAGGFCNFRGEPMACPFPLLIHAASSRKYGELTIGQLAARWEMDERELRPGHAIAIAQVGAFIRFEQIRHLKDDSPVAWLKTHRHVEGPYCWVIDSVQRIQPVPLKGRQGLWKASVDVQPYREPDRALVVPADDPLFDRSRGRSALLSGR